MHYSTVVKVDGQEYAFAGIVKTRNTGRLFRCPKCYSVIPLDTVSIPEDIRINNSTENLLKTKGNNLIIGILTKKVNEELERKTLKRVQSLGACDICHKG